MLASSIDSATYAAHFGLAFSFAHFIAAEQAVAIMLHYRNEFRPEHLQAPQSSIGVFAICSEDPEKIEALRRTREIQRIRRDRGIRGPMPTLDEARAYDFSAEQLERMRTKRSRQIIGMPDEVKTEIEALVQASQADEVIVLTITPDFEDRIRSYELLAEAFSLSCA